MRVLAVDDHQILLRGLKSFLSREGWSLSAATSYGEALRKLQEEHFRAALVDLRLPHTLGDTAEVSVGIELVHQIKHGEPTIPTLVVTAVPWLEEPRYLFFAAQAGAVGYFAKDSHLPVIQALRRLHEVGEQNLFTPEQRSSLLTFAQERPHLTGREREVIRFLEQGLFHKEIAEQLEISTTTLKTHLNHLYVKLRVSDAYQAVRQGRHWGFLETGWLSDK